MTPIEDYGQYYMFATTAILFYDYLLTLADEVCKATGAALRSTHHPCERSNSLGMGRNHGVRGEHHLPYVAR